MLIKSDGKFHITEDPLNTGLCIIEAAVYCDYMCVGTACCRHLELLCFRYSACRIEYDDLCSGKILETFKSSLARITGSSSKDADLLVCACLLCRSSHEVRQELESNILECARRSVPEFKNVFSVVIFVHLNERNRVLTPLLFSISLSCIFEEFSLSKVCKELGEHKSRQFIELHRLHSLEVFFCELGN